MVMWTDFNYAMFGRARDRELARTIRLPHISSERPQGVHKSLPFRELWRAAVVCDATSPAYASTRWLRAEPCKNPPQHL